VARQYRRLPYTREELDNDYEENPRPKARTDRIFALGNQVSETEGLVSSVRTEYQVEDEQHNPRTVELVTVGLCANGHALSEQNRVAGRCMVEGCGKVLCSVRGCAYSCMACGRTMCRQHATFYSRPEGKDGEHVEIYCTRLRCRLSYRVWRFVSFWFGFGG